MGSYFNVSDVIPRGRGLMEISMRGNPVSLTPFLGGFVHVFEIGAQDTGGYRNFTFEWCTEAIPSYATDQAAL